MNMNPFASKTVDSVVASFTKVISELETIQKTRAAENERLEEKLREVVKQQDENQVEIMKALRYKEAFEKLLNG